MKQCARMVFCALLSILAAVSLGACGVSPVQSKPAAYTTRTISIVSTVHIRSGPDTNHSVLATMPAGARPRYICYADGENEDGTTKWFNVSWNGVTGYYSSIADDVPLSAQGNLEGNYGIPRCGTGTDINQSSGSGGSVAVPAVHFDGQAAANYAAAHAQDVRPDLFSDCSWLASQALWYGGLPQSDIWNGNGLHGHLPPVPGTSTATVAGNLVSYLQSHFSVTVHRDVSFTENVLPEARPGDIIAYDWGLKKVPGIDHVAVVVDIAPGQYPEVSEWGTASPREPYQKRGWTWSALHGEWLQQEYPKVTAVLIHINP